VALSANRFLKNRDLNVTSDDNVNERTLHFIIDIAFIVKDSTKSEARKFESGFWERNE